MRKVGAVSRSRLVSVEGSGTLPPGLYLIATPIGNLGDMTARAKEALGALDLLLCEDTRVTRKLLSAYGMTVRLESYHAHNATRMDARILDRIAHGQAVGLVSDAGTPLVSDPGESLVQAVIATGHPVTALPGASAVITALAVSGLPTGRFLFAGFLPPKAAGRRQELATLAGVSATLVFYESPNRLAESLQDMQAVLGPRRAVVARELTKKHEEVRRAPLADLAAYYAGADTPRGEIVVLVGPPDQTAGTVAREAEVDDALRLALQTTTLRDAAAVVSARTGWPKREVYARAIRLTR